MRIGQQLIIMIEITREITRKLSFQCDLVWRYGARFGEVHIGDIEDNKIRKLN